jgi:hypothetical protein
MPLYLLYLLFSIYYVVVVAVTGMCVDVGGIGAWP